MITSQVNLLPCASCISLQPVWSGPSGKHGQSLYLSSGDVDVKTAVMAFYSEINAYDYEQPGYCADTAQFTQLVWKSTRKVGIGISSNGKYLVANYLPAGISRGSFQQVSASAAVSA